MRVLTHSRPRVIVAILAVVAVAIIARNGTQRGRAAADAARAPPQYECRWANDEITIDGEANEAAWESAQVIDTFSAHWLDRPARSATRARLLWDDEYLYFFAGMDDSDLYADLTQHDS